MPDTVVTEIIKYLGVAVPLVLVLLYQLQQANSERRELTTKFLSALESTIKTNAEVMTATTGAVSEMRQAATTEHREMIQELRHMTEALKESRR